MMMTFSMSLSLTSPPTSSVTGSLRRYFTFYSSSWRLRLPAVDRTPELNVRVDPDGNREPEADHAEHEDGRDGVGDRDAEQGERADHPGVDRAHAPGRRRREVGDHAQEVALHEHSERHRDVECLEAAPEDADVAGPPAHRAEHGRGLALRMAQ